MALMARQIPEGSAVRSVTVPKTLHRVRAYGFAQGSGYAFAIFNNTLQPVDVEARVTGSKQTSFAATLAVYGKAQYDKSKNDEWVGPQQRKLGKVGTSVPLTLAPYSLTVLSLR